tara:strand:- start:4 stop:441 length:438 start_codon:yes stop_codon:yes gene_type:complete
MGVIRPTLTITANAASATTEAGPASIALSLSAKPKDSTATAASLVTGVYTTTASPVKLLDSAAYGVDTYVYLKNLSTTTSSANEIYIGITEGTQNDMGTETDTDDRTMILKAGDFAFFPWSGDQDIYAEGNSGLQDLEYWVFKQS